MSPSSRDARVREPTARGSRVSGRNLGGTQVEGRQAVRALLSSRRRRARSVWIAEALEPSKQLDEIVELARSLHVRIELVPRGKLESRAQTASPQGVIAMASELPEVNLDDLLGNRSSPGAPGGEEGCSPPAAPFLLVIDGVTDPFNLGAILRTGLCAGATGVVLARHRSVHVTPAATKAAAGAIEHLDIAVVPGIPGALARLGSRGVWTVGLDSAAKASIYDLDLEASALALVLGSEGRGLARLTRERCDVVVSIPQQSPIGSLNVSAAAAVAAFEIARRRRDVG